MLALRPLSLILSLLGGPQLRKNEEEEVEFKVEGGRVDACASYSLKRLTASAGGR
jgi:hypothetical protein